VSLILNVLPPGQQEVHFDSRSLCVILERRHRVLICWVFRFVACIIFGVVVYSCNLEKLAPCETVDNAANAELVRHVVGTPNNSGGPIFWWARKPVGGQHVFRGALFPALNFQSKQASLERTLYTSTAVRVHVFVHIWIWKKMKALRRGISCFVLGCNPPDCDPRVGHHQNLIDFSLGRAPSPTKTHQNPFITFWIV